MTVRGAAAGQGAEYATQKRTAEWRAPDSAVRESRG